MGASSRHDLSRAGKGNPQPAPNNLRDRFPSAADGIAEMPENPALTATRKSAALQAQRPTSTSLAMGGASTASTACRDAEMPLSG